MDGKYVVIEIQTNSDGTVATIINSYDSYLEAESRYHTILSAAAISNLPMHAASILTNDGRSIEHQGFAHE